MPGARVISCPGTASDAESAVIRRTAEVISNHVEHVSGFMAGGDSLSPEELQRRRRLTKLKRQTCGCVDPTVICKHYYSNLRTQLHGAEGQTEGDTELGGDPPPLQTFLDVYGMDQVVTPRTSPGYYRLLRRRRKRLMASISDSGSAQGSRRRARDRRSAQPTGGSAMGRRGPEKSETDLPKAGSFRQF